MASPRSDRREFGKSLAIGVAALAVGKTYADEQPKGQAPPLADAAGEVFAEPARSVPVAGSHDVIVCGGGPAGIAAALASARSGANTRLLEVNGCLGGIWTAGLLTLIIDAAGKTGIMREIHATLERQGAATTLPGGSIAYDPETMKLVSEELLLEAGVEIQLHTRVCAAAVDENKRVHTVLTESKSGRQAWKSRVFVDCTGDGDLAAQAGCSSALGHPGSGLTQPMSLIVLLAGVTNDGIAQFVRGEAEPRKLGNPKKNLLAEMRRAGVDPSYAGPTIFCIRDGLYAMMANHQYGVLATDAAQVTQATLQARQEVHRLVDALRGLGGVWKGLRLVATAEQIGTREGRRIRGHYEVTTADLANGRHFDDGICHVRFGIDVHSIDPKKTKGIEAKPVRSHPYDIPLRALVARDVTGLLMAGRCISGDFIAHSSYRVTGDAVPMGEAAGVTAALAVQHRLLPHEVPFADVAPALARIRNAQSS